MNRLIKRIEFYAFLVPIIAVAFVSISHVTSWYGISNPVSWAIYLSVGVEVAALSSLAGFSVGLGKYIYPPFILVTIIQFIGNIFYNFQYIDVNGDLFKDWVVLVSPILEVAGIDPTDIDSHKRILAFLEGGFLPPISLFFLHLLIKLSEKMKENDVEVKVQQIVEPVIEKAEVFNNDLPVEPVIEDDLVLEDKNEEKEITVEQKIESDGKKRLTYRKRNG